MLYICQVRKRGRVDSNQRQLVKELRSIGCSVAITSQLGSGFPDIVVGYRGVNYLLEIKDPDKPPSQRKLTTDEIEFQDKWKGQYAVIHTLEEFMTIL